MTELQALPPRIRLDDGLIILHKKRHKKPHVMAGQVIKNWYATINVKRGSRRTISTQTEHLPTAKRFARQQAQIFLARVSEGMSIKADHFVPIAKRSIQDNKLQFERRNQIESWKMYKSQIENFWIEVFGNKRISEITSSDIENELKYLLDVKKLANNTARHYLLGLRWVFKQALKEKKISNLPDFPSLRKYQKPFKARPSFSEEEWKKFNAVLYDFDKDLEKKSATSLKQQMYYRRALRDWCQLISYSGLRTGEASLLKWKDWKIVNEGQKNEHCILDVRGEEKKASKTGARQVIGLKFVNTCLTRRKADTTLNKPDDYIFSHIARHEGKPIMSFRNSFFKALKKANIGFDSEGNKLPGYTPYILRGTYATLRLTLENVDIYHLAQNLGNQVEITEKYYSKAKPKDFAETLSKISED
ncbi:MAG: hypothetical protein CL571_00145 [Alphaproteobacteria bacterium]|jgi:integrase|nr:hypothetical protein [Alphaproteobacteria bacterium]|tara:strand:- start:3555 stop:4808 length:1254 start_codon:yes stop_codon:yes gene_type:complete